MAFNGPVIIVEDDHDEHDLIKACIADAGYRNEVRWFKNGRETIDYLSVTDEQPAIILSDIQMPVMNGLELLSRINKDELLHNKAIPFVFLTVAVSTDLVAEAYDLMAQGFFVKKSNYTGLKEQLALILDYWRQGSHPNNTH